MNPVKIIHLADVHFRPDDNNIAYKEKALASLRTALEKGRDEHVDLFAIAGDLFDRAIQNTANSGLPELQRVIQQMMDVAPVVAVAGTPTHDIRGCYDVLAKTKAEHRFVLLDPRADYYWLGEDHSIQADVWSEDEIMIGTKPILMIHGCPEPGKEQFLAGKRMGREEANEAIMTGMREMLLGFGARRREFPDIPCLFVYHGNVAGATMCNGQAVRPGEITIGRDDLAMVGFDYGALGHDHMAQQIGDLPAYYAGSAYPVNWGELDQKQFNLVALPLEISGAKKWRRYRFYIKCEDYRPIDFPPPGPYWCSGQTEEAHILIAYLPDSAVLTEWWPEARDIEYTEETQLTFTDRFSAPDWWQKTDVQHIPFPHPPRKKIVCTLEEYDNTYWKDQIEGYQAWVVIHDRKEAIAGLDPEHMAESHERMYGALPGSRVTTEIIPTETVRAGHIQEAKGLREKVEIYADNSGEGFIISESILEKAGLLEAEAKAAGETGDGLHISIDKLGLRGAWGIWKGQGKDEIWLDMGNYDPGLIALAWPNGKGKTTLIEFMDPFPELHTRPGKLQDHFRLRDSYQDLYFTDERTGTKYRAFIQIDGQNATGKCEYHLYRNGAPLTDGRKDSYVEAITKLFGSMSLFLRSAFVSQKPTKGNPDLAEATKGEKKALFGELGGLDYLQAHAGTARQKANLATGEILHDRGNLEMAETVIAEQPAKEAELVQTVAALYEARETFKQTTDLGVTLKANAAKLEVELSKQRDIDRDLQAAIGEAQKQAIEQGEIEARIANDRQALEVKPLAEKEIANYDVLQEMETMLNAEKTEILESRERIVAEHRDETDTANAARQEIDAKGHEKAAEAAVLRQHKAVYLVQIEGLIEETGTPLDEDCPTCGQVLPAGKLDELWDIRSQKIATLKQTQSEEFEVEKKLAAAEKAVDECVKKSLAIKYPDEPYYPEFDEAPLSKVRKQLAALDVPKARGWLQKAQEAQVRIDEGQKRIEQIDARSYGIERAIQSFKSMIDTGLEGRYNHAIVTLEIARDGYSNARDDVTRLEVEVKGLEQQVDDLKKASEGVYKLRQSIAGKIREQAEWAYLERACGPDGIQALELDAMGPGIAEVSNRLLAAAYGSRFQIEFRTTRIGGAGSKKKQIEDFQIAIIDSEHGDEQLLETLSGGEAVWIKRAIYDAFGIIRDRNTGQRFLTAMQDEADGALDPEARLAYFRLLEAAHLESGRRHSIIITHSESAQEMIAQRIDMSELTVEGAEG